jgi:hypothetical protein
MIHGSKPGRRYELYFSLIPSHAFLGPTQPRLSGKGRSKGLAPRLRMSGATPLRPLYALVAWTGATIILFGFRVRLCGTAGCVFPACYIVLQITHRAHAWTIMAAWYE